MKKNSLNSVKSKLELKIMWENIDYSLLSLFMFIGFEINLNKYLCA